MTSRPMVPGKYAVRLRAASNVVVLEPEVARAFPNAEAANDALLGLINLAKAAARPTLDADARKSCARRLAQLLPPPNPSASALEIIRFTSDEA